MLTYIFFFSKIINCFTFPPPPRPFSNPIGFFLLRHVLVNIRQKCPIYWLIHSFGKKIISTFVNELKVYRNFTKVVKISLCKDFLRFKIFKVHIGIVSTMVSNIRATSSFLYRKLIFTVTKNIIYKYTITILCLILSYQGGRILKNKFYSRNRIYYILTKSS